MSMALRLGMKRSHPEGVRVRLVERESGVLRLERDRPGVTAVVRLGFDASRALRCQRGMGAFSTGAAKSAKSSSRELTGGVILAERFPGSRAQSAQGQGVRQQEKGEGGGALYERRLVRKSIGRGGAAVGED